jgi:hypothetical protein
MMKQRGIGLAGMEASGFNEPPAWRRFPPELKQELAVPAEHEIQLNRFKVRSDLE